MSAFGALLWAGAVMAMLQPPGTVAPPARLHPAPAHRTDVTYSYHCGTQQLTLRYSNTYRFDDRSSGKATALQAVKFSSRSLTRQERDRLAAFFAGFAIIEQVKGTCYEGDFLLGVHGRLKAEFDAQAIDRRAPPAKPVLRTVTIRGGSGILVPELGSSQSDE